MTIENGSEKSPLDAMRKSLSPFLTANTASDLAEKETPTSKLAVLRPWNDDSFVISVPAGPAQLIEALNNIYLPERFTAIWHTDSRRFEIIYTLLPDSSELLGRDFTFQHKRRNYQCAFGDASARLLLLAEHHLPTAASTTQFRNLSMLQLYALVGKAPTTNGMTVASSPDVKPVSFWINGIASWNEDDVLDLVRHINFYMYYFDTRAPQIIIHPAKSESVARQPQQRYPHGAFPKAIVGQELDDPLLHFWAASISGDPVRRFLYNFQILEYAASFWIEEEIKREIRRTLAAPNANDNIEALTDRVIRVVGATKMPETAKLEHLLKTTVNADLIWREIEGNLRQFSIQMAFDGEFTVQPIVKEGWTVDDFGVNWIPAFSNAIRGIRNALSHGKEQRVGGVITPTTSNFQRLQLWLSFIAVAAREVIHYRTLA